MKIHIMNSSIQLVYNKVVSDIADYRIAVTPPKATAPTRPTIERDAERPTAPAFAPAGTEVLLALELEPVPLAPRVRDLTPALEHSVLNAKSVLSLPFLRWRSGVIHTVKDGLTLSYDGSAWCCADNAVNTRLNGTDI